MEKLENPDSFLNDAISASPRIGNTGTSNLSPPWPHTRIYPKFNRFRNFH